MNISSIDHIDGNRAGEGIDISFDEIMASSDVEWLGIVYVTLYDMSKDIKDEFDAYDTLRCIDQEWAIRAGSKLKMTKLAMRRVERRFLQLGKEPPYPIEELYRKSLAQVKRRLEEAEKKIQKLQPVNDSLLT